MSALATIITITGIGPQDAALAARLVERHCGPDAPAVLAILGLYAVSAPAPRRQPARRAAPDPFRRTTKGKGRRQR
jgi:hypothetical protein